MIHCHALNPDVRLELVPTSPIDPAISAAIDRLWEAEAAARGAGLFDGPVLALLGHAPDRLTVEAVTYRRLIAARRDAGLAARLRLRIFGVTGLLLCPEGVVLGRRSRRVHVEPGRWEPAPAGTLDRPDWRAAVLDELGQELGLDAGRVGPPEAVALVEEEATGVCDILCCLPTSVSAAGILSAWRAAGTDEYEDLAVLAPEALPGFLSANAAALLPALRPMLTACGLLPV